MKQHNLLNWPTVLQFLYTEHQNISLRQNLFAMQKKELTDQIKELKGKLMAHIAINTDLKNRNSMLEHSLRLLKSSDERPSQQKKEVPIPQRRPKSNHAQLKKILSGLQIGSLLQQMKKDVKIERIEMPKIPQTKSNYKEYTVLEGHQDGVRDLCFLSSYLVSVSEDSTMKLWNLGDKNQKSSRQFKTDKISQQNDTAQIQCVATIREHEGPIFTVVEGNGCIFTGGIEGIIRCWNIPSKIKDSNKLLISSCNNSQDKTLEPIWQLVYSIENSLLFASSSQTVIRAYASANHQSKRVCSYKRGIGQDNIPTTLCVYSTNLVTGFVNSNTLTCFDIQTQQIRCNMVIPTEVSTNKLIYNANTLFGAFEDGAIRIFKDDKMVHAFDAHTESAISLCGGQHSNELFSCGQDGLVKLWDTRKYQVISVWKAHNKKYQQSAHCIASNKFGMAASGGADAIIKVYNDIKN